MEMTQSDTKCMENFVIIRDLLSRDLNLVRDEIKSGRKNLPVFNNIPVMKETNSDEIFINEVSFFCILKML